MCLGGYHLGRLDGGNKLAVARLSLDSGSPCVMGSCGPHDRVRAHRVLMGTGGPVQALLCRCLCSLPGSSLEREL